MRIRSRSLALAAASLFLVSGAASAQGGSSNVTFDGNGFAFDEALGASVNVLQVPADTSVDSGPVGPIPARIAFTLYGARAEDKKSPLTQTAPRSVRFFRTADLAGFDWQSRQMAELQALLDERPDLAEYLAPGEEGQPLLLPYVLDGSAGQGMEARAHYIDTPEVSGVAYLTVFRQDIFPFAAGDFWYTFQGLSADGEWYVAADFKVEASMFPAEVSQKDAKRLTKQDRWYAYQAESVETADAAAADAFTPPLSSIDALVESITFGPDPSA
jgi:hypothetical protein